MNNLFEDELGNVYVVPTYVDEDELHLLEEEAWNRQLAERTLEGSNVVEPKAMSGVKSGRPKKPDSTLAYVDEDELNLLEGENWNRQHAERTPEETSVVKPKAKSDVKAGRPKKHDSNSTYLDYEEHNVAQFLEMIEENPVLWDTKNDSHHRQEVKNKHFDEIEQNCFLFMKRGRVHGATAKKLWKELEEAYKNERKRKENQPSGSGGYVCRFKFYGNLSFLDMDRSQRAVKNSFISTSKIVTAKVLPRPVCNTNTPKRFKNENFERLVAAVEEGNRVVNEVCNAPNTSESNQNGNQDIHDLLDKVLDAEEGVEKLKVKCCIATYLFDLAEKRREGKAANV